MSLSAEAKVGGVTVLALLLLAYMIVFLGVVKFGDKGYPLTITFGQVSGLKAGNLVRYAGVEVGKVEAVRVVPNGVDVVTSIQHGVQIPTGSIFGIGTDGLLGEKFVDVTPPAMVRGYYKSGDKADGQNPQGLDQVMATADKLMQKLDRLANSLDEVLGDPKSKDALKNTILNLNDLSAALSRMAVSNEDNVNAMAQNLAIMSSSLREVAGRVDRMLTGLDGNGKLTADLKDTIQNLKSASARMERMAAALEPVATDPDTAKNLKNTLRNAREVTEKANRMLNKVEQVKVQAGIETMYNGGSDRWRTNADVRINANPTEFAVIGVTDIGESGRFNLQLGRDNGVWGQRIGVIENKAGVGLDFHIGSGIKLSAEAYDPNDMRIKLRSEFKVAPDTFIVGESTSLNKDAQRNSYVGVRRSF